MMPQRERLAGAGTAAGLRGNTVELIARRDFLELAMPCELYGRLRPEGSRVLRSRKAPPLRTVVVGEGQLHRNDF